MSKLNTELDERVKNLTTDVLKDRVKLIETTLVIMAMNRSFPTALNALHAQAATNQANITAYHAELLELKQKQGKGFQISWLPQ